MDRGCAVGGWRVRGWAGRCWAGASRSGWRRCFDRTIDVAIARLRRKLEDDGRHAQIIKTVRGGGYVLASAVGRG